MVRIAVTVGELLDALWPPSAGRGRPRDSTNWPRLLRALYRARDFHVPDATVRPVPFPLAVRRLPDGVAHPWADDGGWTPGRRPGRDELIVLDLEPVPGAETGGSVDLYVPGPHGSLQRPAMVRLPGRSIADMATWQDTAPCAWRALSVGAETPLTIRCSPWQTLRRCRVRRRRQRRPGARRYRGAVGAPAGPGDRAGRNGRADRHTRVAPAASGGAGRPAERPRRWTHA